MRIGIGIGLKLGASGGGVDTTAPVISAFAYVDPNVNTTVDEAGTQYWILDESAVKPTSAQIAAGNGQDDAAAEDSGNFAVSVGVNSEPVTLTAADGTWYLYTTIKDASGNYSLVPDGEEIVISSAVATSITHAAAAEDKAHGSSGDYTASAVSFGAADTNRRVLVSVNTFSTAAHTITGMTIGGVTATEIVQKNFTGVTDLSTAIFAASIPTGTSGDVVVSFDANVLDIAIDVFRMIKETNFTANATSTSDGLGTTIAHDLNTTTDGCAITVAMSANADLSTPATGFTEVRDSDLNSSEYASAAFISGIGTGETPRTMTQTYATDPLEWAAAAASWA